MKKFRYLLSLYIFVILMVGCIPIETLQMSDQRYNPNDHAKPTHLAQDVPNHIYISSGWIVDAVSKSKKGYVGSRGMRPRDMIGGYGGDLARYSLLNIDKIVVHKGYFERQYVVANITFYYKNGRVISAGTMQGTSRIRSSVYEGRVVDYKASTKGRFLNNIRFITEG